MKAKKSPKFNDQISKSVFILRLLGIIPFKGRNYTYHWTVLINIVVAFCSVSHVGMLTFYGFSKGELEYGHVCEWIMVVGCLLKYAIMFSVRSQLLALHAECRKTWNSCELAEHCVVDKDMRKVQHFYKACVFVHVLLQSFYTITAFVTRLPPTTPDDKNLRVTPFRFIPGGMEVSTTYTLIFTSQVVILEIVSLISLGLDTALPWIIVLCSSYTKVLQNRFLVLRLWRCRNKFKFCDEQVYRRLIGFVRFHQNILDLCNRIQKLSTAFFFVQIITSGYNLSLAAFKLTSSDADRYNYLPIFSTNLFQLVLCQLTPVFLFEESKNVNTQAYFSYSPDMKIQCCKILLIILTRAQRPVQLKAGGFIIVSVETFAFMMNSAYKLFMLLREINS